MNPDTILLIILAVAGFPVLIEVTGTLLSLAAMISVPVPLNR